MGYPLLFPFMNRLATRRSGLDGVGPEKWPQHIRYCDRPVRVLVVLEHRDQRAPDCQAGTIERMQRFGLARGRIAPACLHASRLEIPEIAAGRNLAITLLPGQPDFQVIGAAAA